jgi:predicted DNA-binding protein with PD1-like motif
VDDIFVRLDPGEELHSALQRLVSELGLVAAAVTSGIGRMRITCMGYLDDDQTYHTSDYEEPMELLSLQGNISYLDGAPFTHLHGVFSMDSGRVVGGHLFSTEVHVTAEIHLRIMGRNEDFPMQRCEIAGSEFKQLRFGSE